jgi:hypothetical protein
VTQNVAYHLDICAGIDLSAGVTVSKSMGANYFGRNTRQPGVVPDAIPYRGAGYGLIGHVLAQENGMNGFGRRPFPSQVYG